MPSWVNFSFLSPFISFLPQAEGDASPTSKLHRLLAESRQMVQNLEQSSTFSLTGSPNQVCISVTHFSLSRYTLRLGCVGKWLRWKKKKKKKRKKRKEKERSKKGEKLKTKVLAGLVNWSLPEEAFHEFSRSKIFIFQTLVEKHIGTVSIIGIFLLV